LPVVVVRLFNTVGPRQVGMYGMVLPRFVQAALHGEPLKVFGTGEQSRCFCHVSDVVEALVQLILKQEAYGNVFNVGSDEEISINDLAQRVINLTGSSSSIERLTYEQAYGQPFDDMQRRVPDLTRIRNLIGFKPRLNLDEIIQSVITEYRQGVP